MDLPCDWARFLHACTERRIEDSAIIIVATWYREGPDMTQQLEMNHGHPDGDIVTSLMAYHWFCAARDYHRFLLMLYTQIIFFASGKVAPCLSSAC